MNHLSLNQWLEMGPRATSSLLEATLGYTGELRFLVCLQGRQTGKQIPAKPRLQWENTNSVPGIKFISTVTVDGTALPHIPIQTLRLNQSIKRSRYDLDSHLGPTAETNTN